MLRQHDALEHSHTRTILSRVATGSKGHIGAIPVQGLEVRLSMEHPVVRSWKRVQLWSVPMEFRSG